MREGQYPSNIRFNRGTSSLHPQSFSRIKVPHDRIAAFCPVATVLTEYQRIKKADLARAGSPRELFNRDTA